MVLSGGYDDHSGLFTLHFSNLFLPQGSPPKATGSKSTEISTSSSIARRPFTQFSHWHILIHIDVESDTCFARESAKVYSPTSSLASAAARGVNVDGSPVVGCAPDGVPIVPIYQKDRKCKVLVEGPGRTFFSMLPQVNLNVQVTMDRLEAELIGMSGEDLKDVTLRCSGQRVCGWQTGEVSVSIGDKPLKLAQPLRFLLKPYQGRCCTNCLEPVYAVGYMCDECKMTTYCSRECSSIHMKRHGWLCPILKESYSIRSGMLTSDGGTAWEFVAWWRCWEDSKYTILVDPNNPFGRAMELHISTLQSAQEYGLRYRFISPKKASSVSSGAEKMGTLSTPYNASSVGSSSEVSINRRCKASWGEDLLTNEGIAPEEFIEFCCVLFRELNRSAVSEGYISLAAACLNYLFAFSPCLETSIQAHSLFYYSISYQEFESQISTIEEYVAHARPLQELAVSLIEYALKSRLSLEFWQRIKLAKNVLFSWYNANLSVVCPESDELRNIIPSQQRETLILLSKVCVIMASRTIKEDATKLLEHGEKYLRDCLDDTTIGAEMSGIIHLRLAAHMLLYDTPEKTAESRRYRKEGELLLAAARQDPDGQFDEEK